MDEHIDLVKIYILICFLMKTGNFQQVCALLIINGISVANSWRYDVVVKYN